MRRFKVGDVVCQLDRVDIKGINVLKATAFYGKNNEWSVLFDGNDRFDDIKRIFASGVRGMIRRYGRIIDDE